MNPFLSALLTSVMLLCGGAAVVVMMNRLGRPQQSPSPRQLVLHRLFGWPFVAAFLVLIATMFGRFYAYWEEDSPRIVIHYTAAFALLVLLLLKIAIARLYPGFRTHLFALGVLVFLLAFLTAASALSHYLVRMTQRAPYISHASLSSAPDLELGKQLLIERCRTCHVLDTILRPRPAKAWENVVDAMAKLAWPRIRPDEARQILHYLVTTRIPREPSAGTGYEVLDEHCLPCHEPAEVFKSPRTREEWVEVVARMSRIAPELVHVADHGPIVDALLAAQAREAAPTEAEAAGVRGEDLR